MRGTIVILGLLLAGCDDWPRAHSRNDIKEIVLEETSALRSDDRRLRARVDEAEAKINGLESEISSLKREVSYLD